MAEPGCRMELLRYTDPKFSSYSSEKYLPLSMDRPSPILHIPRQVELDDPIEGRAACHVAEAEWRVAGKLDPLMITRTNGNNDCSI